MMHFSKRTPVTKWHTTICLYKTYMACGINTISEYLGMEVLQGEVGLDVGLKGWIEYFVYVTGKLVQSSALILSTL